MWMLCIALCSTTAAGQGRKEERAAGKKLDDAIQERVDAMVNRETTTWKNYMAVLVGNLSKVCCLEAAQTKRLTLAAKGATEKSLASYRKKVTHQVKYLME